MKQRSSVIWGLRDAVQGFLQAKSAEGCSERTTVTYAQHLRVWLEHQGDKAIDQITAQEMRAFLAWLRTDYKPRRFGGRTDPLSSKTVHNFWITLSAFFSWAATEFDLDSPMKTVRAPSFEEAPIEPYTPQEVERLLKACDQTAEVTPANRVRYSMQRPSATRDRAMILTLLDTGLRASELCALRVGSVDLGSGRIEVRHGQQGGAKGGKGRFVYVGKTARRQLWRYLHQREDGRQEDAPLFLGKFGKPINKTSLRQLLTRLGQKAGVKKTHPHRFRHTFAITYLRGGGDVFSLQRLLGHASLDMVQHYAKLAEVDVQMAHGRASPADHWHL